MYSPYASYAPIPSNFDLDALKNKENDLNNASVCVVCADPKTSGHHYGVLSCEGCKGFFKRYTNAVNKTFVCRRGTNDCVIDIASRGKCQACRLRKCIEGGMVRGSGPVTPNRFKAPVTPMQTRNVNIPQTPQPEIQSVLSIAVPSPECEPMEESPSESLAADDEKNDAYFENLRASILQSYRSGHQNLPFAKQIAFKGYQRRLRVMEALKQADGSKVLKEALGDDELAILSTFALIHGGKYESESDGSSEAECLEDLVEILDQQLTERGFRSQLARILDLVVALCVG